MHKPVLAVAAVGIVGFALWKLASVLLLPLIGTLLGVVLTIVKFVAIGALIWLAFWFFTRKKDKGGEAPAT
jgi:threonine/homoserine/homoserine lactone efflux protein